jgi:hypothetical protein
MALEVEKLTPALLGLMHRFPGFRPKLSRHEVPGYFVPRAAGPCPKGAVATFGA